LKTFACGERVACRNYSGSVKWKFGIVSARKRKLHYAIRLDDGRSWERHVNQMRKIGNDTPSSATGCLDNDHYYWDSEQSRELVHPSNPATPNTENLPAVPQNDAPVSPQLDNDIDEESAVEVQRRPVRARKRPDFFSEYIAK